MLRHRQFRRPHAATGGAILLTILGAVGSATATEPVGAGSSPPPDETASVRELTERRPGVERVPEPKLIVDGDWSTLIYTCRHAPSELLRDAIEGFLSFEGHARASQALNALIVVDHHDRIASIRRLLDELDRETQQLLVDVRVLEVTLDSDLEYELSHVLTGLSGTSFLQDSELTLGTPGANPLSDQGLALNVVTRDNGARLDSFIRLLISRGKGRILSSPNLIVSAGNEASIVTGEEVPIQSSTVVSGSVSTTTQFKQVGIKLRVRLLQIAGDTARLEVNPEVSAVTGFTTGPDGITNPIIALRNFESTISLKDGEILTVGGLLRTDERLDTRGVPVLENIPVVGPLLFQSRRETDERTQLIFFLRTHILAEGEPGVIRTYRPDSGMAPIDGLPIGRSLEEDDDEDDGPETRARSSRGSSADDYD